MTRIFRITDPNNFYFGRLCKIKVTEKIGDVVVHTAALHNFSKDAEVTFAVRPEYLLDVTEDEQSA